MPDNSPFMEEALASEKWNWVNDLFRKLEGWLEEDGLPFQIRGHIWTHDVDMNDALGFVVSSVEDHQDDDWYQVVISRHPRPRLEHIEECDCEA